MSLNVNFMLGETEITVSTHAAETLLYEQAAAADAHIQMERNIMKEKKTIHSKVNKLELFLGGEIIAKVKMSPDRNYTWHTK